MEKTIKKCPFRKSYGFIFRYEDKSYKRKTGSNETPSQIDETFLDCIGKECMAYIEFNGRAFCKLMK